jgi:hypothetical protein
MTNIENTITNITDTFNLANKSNITDLEEYDNINQRIIKCNDNKIYSSIDIVKNMIKLHFIKNPDNSEIVNLMIHTIYLKNNYLELFNYPEHLKTLCVKFKKICYQTILYGDVFLINSCNKLENITFEYLKNEYYDLFIKINYLPNSTLYLNIENIKYNNINFSNSVKYFNIQTLAINVLYPYKLQYLMCKLISHTKQDFVNSVDCLILKKLKKIKYINMPISTINKNNINFNLFKKLSILRINSSHGNDLNNLTKIKCPTIIISMVCNKYQTSHDDIKFNIKSTKNIIIIANSFSYNYFKSMILPPTLNALFVCLNKIDLNKNKDISFKKFPKVLNFFENVNCKILLNADDNNNKHKILSKINVAFLSNYNNESSSVPNTIKKHSDVIVVLNNNIYYVTINKKQFTSNSVIDVNKKISDYLSNK